VIISQCRNTAQSNHRRNRQLSPTFRNDFRRDLWRGFRRDHFERPHHVTSIQDQNQWVSRFYCV